MYCPNCGKENNSNQSFCRSCGLSLTKSFESIAEHKEFRTENSTKKGKEIFSNANILFILGTFLLMFFGFFGVYYSGYYLGFSISFRLVLIVIFESLCLAILFYKFLFLEKNDDFQFQEINKIEFEPNTMRLTENVGFEPVSSITDNSTELLFVEKKTRKL